VLNHRVRASDGGDGVSGGARNVSPQRIRTERGVLIPPSGGGGGGGDDDRERVHESEDDTQAVYTEVVLSQSVLAPVVVPRPYSPADAVVACTLFHSFARDGRVKCKSPFPFVH